MVGAARHQLLRDAAALAPERGREAGRFGVEMVAPGVHTQLQCPVAAAGVPPLPTPTIVILLGIETEPVDGAPHVAVLRNILVNSLCL